MGILNKRNALLGWAVWTLGKRVAKKKAKGAVPGTGGDSGGGKLAGGLGAVAAAAAAAAGALWFWRRRGDDGDASGEGDYS